MSQRDDILKVLLSEEQLKEKCAEMGAQITRDYAGKNLLLVGTIGLFWTACKMLDESEKKRKAEKERADAAEAELAEMQFEKDICCDGKASVTKKDV